MKITKKILEQKLMDIIEIDFIEDDEGNKEKISAMDKQAKVAAIKQLCNMRGYNSVEKKEIINKNYTLEF
jgi:cytoplasmic iron level regulating protein YaaA (DUF328/UPF0246 family)